MSLCGVAENLLADFVFLTMTVFIAWVSLYALGRRRLLGFFGAASASRLVIYVSNLRVPQFGAMGIDGRKRSYEGFAAAFGEVQYALRLKQLFSYTVPSTSHLPGILGRLFVSDIEVDIIPSPLQAGQLDNSSPMIVLGSPAFNIAASYAEQIPRCLATFRDGVAPERKTEVAPRPSGLAAYSNQPEHAIIGGTTVTIAASLSRPATRGSPEPAQEDSAIIVEGVPPITDPLCGFVERIVDEQSNRLIFYVAGLSENATTGAAHFLISHWRRLSRTYRTDIPFLVMLRSHPTDSARATVVFERVGAPEASHGPREAI